MRIRFHQAMKQALWFPEHANPEVSLILFHYSYSQYKYRNIFKETSDIQIILTYCIVIDLLYNPNNSVLIFIFKKAKYTVVVNIGKWWLEQQTGRPDLCNF